MKGFRFFTKSLIFVLILSALAFAQTEKTQASAALKIGMIDTTAFFDKENGIKELVETNDKLEAEFKRQKDELAVLEETIQKLWKEMVRKCDFSTEYDLETLKKVQADCEKLVSEFDKLSHEYKQKEQTTKSLYEKRESETVGIVKKKIGDAIQQFAKERNYILVVDITKCDSCLPGNFDGSDNDDITKEFIKYYNENFATTKTQ